MTGRLIGLPLGRHCFGAMFVLGGLNLKQDVFEWMAICDFHPFSTEDKTFRSKLERARAYIYTYKIRALTIVRNGVIVVEKNHPPKKCREFSWVTGVSQVTPI